MKALNMITWLLLIIGGLNWGLVALAQYNLVDTVFGAGSQVGKIVYILVGLSALWSIVPFVKCCQSGGAGGGCCS